MAITKPEDFDQYIRKSGARFMCAICDQYSGHQRRDTRNHIESVHYPNSFTYQCQFCEVVLNTNKALTRHKERYHKF